MFFDYILCIIAVQNTVGHLIIIYHPFGWLNDLTKASEDANVTLDSSKKLTEKPCWFVGTCI